ncbi:MAG: hypothetical protein EP332_00455 [Bacteroidetes bacterium]|nr:MAG: hypothetical protein EP332_00455 [Bacteroidota bacterium]
MSENYFTWYGITPAFFPDEKAIRTAYYRLSLETHPDHSDNHEEAMKLSSRNNAAYQTLKQFDTRLPYLLGLLGFYTPEEKYSLDPEFLMEMMELNESISFAEGEEKASYEKQVTDLETALNSQLESLCKTWDETQEKSLLESIKEGYYKRKYLRRLRQNLNNEDAEL